jgi:type IX secretion system PorP/SprF family membrane protein
MIMRQQLYLLLLLLSANAYAQSDQHYTMFMYNKLIYNPAYAGSRDLTSLNADYRDQWDGINGAPKTANVTADGPVGSFMKPFRKVALGFSLSHETLGVERNTDIKAAYAYRIKFKDFVLSMGLSAGADLYSANYSQLNLYQPNDPNFQNNIRNAVLPNVGAGEYMYSDDTYFGFSVPNIIQNAYDKKEKDIRSNFARQSSGLYITCGHIFPVNESIKVLPQFIFRTIGSARYKLPISCDINCTAIYNERFMAGVTYRTDKSFEGIVHIQATTRVNVGYAYDYLLSDLNGYNGGTHEIVVGYDIIRDNSKFLTPRFIRKF